MLWKNRNNVKFGERRWSASSLYSRVYNETMSYKNKERSDNGSSMEKMRKEEDRSFEKLKGNLLYVDAAWKEGFKSGCGFVIVKEKKITTEGFGIEAAANPLHAELKSIWFGLDNVKKKGIRIEAVLSDCRKAIKIPKKEEHTL
ncbi:hypothetical protein Cni_G01831 [Canna indica]|uniref:Uncharacterized protein n=1 Tax=Canna indica TaxID=4628 RepID=A0AAQ3JNB5_9LILI|nr:hypothetical protein Cni_G01831 [Canna indica]